jgi:hypothetical protein
MHSKMPQESTGRSTNDKEGVSAYAEPLLQLSAPGGISAMTPGDAILSAGGISCIAESNAKELAGPGNASGSLELPKPGGLMDTLTDTDRQHVRVTPVVFDALGVHIDRPHKPRVN